MTPSALKELNNGIDRYASYHFERLYDYSPKEYRRWSRKYTSYYATLLPEDRSSSILDLGCAGGRFLYFLRSLGYSNLTGVDSDEKQLVALRNVIACQAYRHDILEFLRTCPDSYDFISCHHVIEHLSRELSCELLRLAYSALRPGGRLVVSTPNGGRPWAGWHMFADLSHDHLYTSVSLKEVMEVAGFRDVLLRPEGPVAYNLMSSVRWLIWKLWQEPYLKFTFIVENGLGCLSGSKLIVAGGLIATGVKLP